MKVKHVHEKVNVPKGLASKFMPPENGRYETITNPHGQNLSVLRYEAENAKADLIVQTGLNEPKEKYSELHRDLVERGYNVHAMDWPYQGFSDGAPHHRRRHTNTVISDIKDYRTFVDHVQSTRVSNDVPLYMMGHSYGGHILSRYIADEDHLADGVFMTAPMIDFFFVPLMPFRSLSPWGAGAYKLAKTLATVKGGDAYAPTSKDWSPDDRIKGPDIYSNDPERKHLSNLWIGANKKTQVGRPTLGWVMDSIKACRALKKQNFSHLKIPFTVAVGGKEVISDNGAMYELAARVPGGRVVQYDEAPHEMWMCSDDVRDDMLARIDRDISRLRKDRGLDPA